jgi:DHA2 family multidrug resistance protein
MSDQHPAAPAAPSPPGEEWRPRGSPWLIALAVMLGTFMEVLDTSVANVALPHIAGSLSASPEEATWVLTSYLVSNAIVLPAAAWLGGIFGRKRFLMACIATFALASAACGAAATLGLLIVARVLQGAGGGALQPIAQAVLLESFPPARRGAAMAAYAMGVIVAPILGPTLGGWITDSYSWRWIFYINLPVGVLALGMVHAFVEDPPYAHARRPGRIDALGLALMVVWLGTLQIVLDRGQEDDWLAAAWIRWFLAISTAAMIAFIARELTVDAPIVDLAILRDRNFGLGIVLITGLGMILYSTTAMLPLFLQTLMGYPALQSGLAISPRGVGAFLAATLVGRLAGFVDTRLMMVVGFGLLSYSGLTLSRLTFDMAMANVAWATFLNGVATPLVFISLTTTAMGMLRNEQMGNATGLYNLMRNLGGSLGISTVATLLARRSQAHQAVLVSHLTPYDPAYQRWLDTTRSGLAARVGPTASGPRAMGMLYRTLVKQATLLAFVDNFRLVSLLALASAPLVFLFRRVRARGAH